MNTFKKRNILILCLSALMVLSTVLSAAGCAKPMEYSEIEDRFVELVESSYGVNSVLFGDGLEVYERVYDPKSSMKTFKSEEKLYYYYDVVDESYGRVVAYRSSWTEPYNYMEITEEEKSGKKFDYADEASGVYGYILEGYVEKKYDFYYTESDPLDYDVVRFDIGYNSIEDIKAYAETVYSRNYLENTVYESLFDGIASLDEEKLVGKTARFFEYTNSEGKTVLMRSNTEKSIFPKEKIVFDFSTAKVVKPYKEDFVNISVTYYYENDRDKSYTITVSMIIEDGVWKLDSQTF